MSIEFANDLGYYILTEKFINDVYKECENSPKINSNLFAIFSPFCPKKVIRKNGKAPKTSLQTKVKEANQNFEDLRKDVEYVQKYYLEFRQSLVSQSVLSRNEETRKNTEALQTADYVYTESGKFPIENSWGSNFGPPIVKPINNSNFLFPKNATFYSKDVNDIKHHLNDKKFDLILLDPPWYNKYIKRKRKINSAAYNMMSNEDLKNIPIEDLLTENGVVFVWCTNCQNHLNELIMEIFNKWKVSFVGKWYWLKVTKTGETVCNFSEPPGKQPFEQLIIAAKNPKNMKISERKIIVSIPSAIHSNKPPLVEVFKQFLPENSQCLEIFARYLLPNWTSYGNEVLRFQHESLYVFENDKKNT